MNYDSFFCNRMDYNFTIFFEIEHPGIKRKLPKKRNFKFDANNGFGGVFMQSHVIQILPVKKTEVCQWRSY